MTNKSLKRFDRVIWMDYVIALLLGLALVYGILYRAGTLVSGYHFLDDHELIRMEVSFVQNHASLADVMLSNIRSDLLWRFRPFYWVERTLLAYVFGTNLLYWNYFTAVKLIFTTVFLYLAFRYLKCDLFVSALATGLILLGAQFTPWYRSANQESTGLLLLALALLLVAAQWYHRQYKSFVYNTFLVIVTVLCGLVKESFALCIPVIIAQKFWLEYCDNEPGNFWKCLKNNLITYCLLLLALIVDVGMIVFYVGTDHVSYAGFHAESTLLEYWQGIVYSGRHYLTWYIKVGVLLLCGQIVVLFLRFRSKEIQRYRRPLGIAAIGWYIILVQLVAPAAMSSSRNYAWDGQLIRVFFQHILDHTDENSQVICAFADEELNLATECWLETHERTQVYSYRTDRDELYNYVQIQGASPTDFDWNRARVVVCYDYQIEQLLPLMGLIGEDGYTYDTSGRYAVISRVVEINSKFDPNL